MDNASTPLGLIRLHAIGGFSRIGGSSALIQMDNVSILLDCGINSGLARDPVPSFLHKVKPDLVLVSHAHIDHVGALPIVVRNNPGIPVFASAPTKMLAEIMLRDCMKLSSAYGPAIYSDPEIDKAIESITTVPFETIIPFRHLNIKFRKAGHILGASTIILQGNHRMVYTGDFSASGTRITPSPSLPDPPEKCDLMLSEVTYGTRELALREAEEQRMLSKIKWILKEGGRVLIPSFALGRAQEVISLLVTEVNRGTIPKVPVYLDGMVKEITEAYASLSEWLPDRTAAESLTDWRILKPVGSELERIDLLFGSEPCVIIASSGMLSGGWSVLYAKDTCSRSNSAIFFVGYLDEESPGHKLRQMAEGTVRLLDDEVIVKCHIDSFALSAHANHQGILELANRYSPSFYVPVHGDPASRWAVAKEVSLRTKASPVMPFEGEIFAISSLTGKSEPVLSNSDILADQFLRLRDNDGRDPAHISTRLWEFLERNRVTDYSAIEQTLWSIFKLSANFVSTDPWITIKDRARFFLACLRLLSDHFPQRVEVFTKQFHRSVPNFLSNLVVYGGNRSWRDRLASVQIESLEAVQALLIQTWEELGVDPTLSDVYYRCKARCEWPANSEVETKFSTIFEEIEPVFSLLAPLPRWVQYLIIDSTLIAAVDGQIVLVLHIIPRGKESSQSKADTDLLRLQDTRLFKLSGWKMDPSRITPSTLVLDAGQHKTGLVTRSTFDEWFSKAIEPFKKDVPPGTFIATSDLPTQMEQYGFDLNIQPNFVEALHRESGSKILVGLASTRNRFEHYRRIRGAVVDFEKFKLITRRLSKLWKHKMDVQRGDAELGTEVIVSYGWHSYLASSERRRALEDAMEVYQYSHIIHILRMLENYWGKRTSLEKYSRVARQDREWLQETYGFKRTAEIEGFNMEVRDFCGLSFARSQYDRYIVLVT
jgi:Cft2 family RNA processing exonuclease